MNSPSNLWRLSGIAGLLFVVVSLAASFGNVQPPAYDADRAEIAAWFAEESDQYRVGHVIAGLAFLLFYFPFFAGLYARLRGAEGPPAIWSTTMLAGAILSPAAGTIAGTFIIGASALEGDTSPDVASFALTAHFYALTVSGAYAGIAMVGASVVILRTAVFPRWLGWAGAIAGLAAVAGTAALAEHDPHGPLATISSLAWLAFFVWLVPLSIKLIRDIATPRA